MEIKRDSLLVLEKGCRPRAGGGITLSLRGINYLDIDLGYYHDVKKV
jgi:hypothetical protein